MYFDHDLGFYLEVNDFTQCKALFLQPQPFRLRLVTSGLPLLDFGTPFWNVSRFVFGSFPTDLTDAAYVTDPTDQTDTTDLILCIQTS